MSLLKFTDSGIYCEAGDFYIDPWRRVEKAVITHAHSDHARWGMGHYLAHPISGEVMKLRLGADISLQTAPYSESVIINGVKVSFHPAGHIPGSSQVRVEHKGEIWVAAGDYKTQPDNVSDPFETVKCHGFITESTFGLPVYKWKSNDDILTEINEWWSENAANNITSVIFCYSLGKAQRILNGLQNIGPVFCHGAIANTNEALINAGLSISDCAPINRDTNAELFKKAIVLAPPGAEGTPWMKRFKDVSTGIASGWMQLRGTRRRRNADRGFVMSDHADWPGLIDAVKSTGADKIVVTHGYTDVFARYLAENGWNAITEKTEFGAEEEEVSQIDAA